MTQSAFDWTRPPSQPCATSRAGAERIAPQLSRLQSLVLAWFRERGEQGGTEEELIDAMQAIEFHKERTWGARRVELTEPKYGRVHLRDSGRKRVGRSGCEQIVWVVK